MGGYLLNIILSTESLWMYKVEVVGHWVGRSLWYTTFILMGSIGLSVVAVGSSETLNACILFLVFAGGVMVLVFYTVSQSSLWSYPGLSMLSWPLLPMLSLQYPSSLPLHLNTSMADVALLSLLLFAGLAVTNSISY